MFLEKWPLAQIHVVSVLSQNQGNLTLHSDKTTYDTTYPTQHMIFKLAKIFWLLEL